jgi:hypothetical protein
VAKVGTLTLGTEVDTKGVDEGLGDIERKVTGKGFMNKFSRMFSGIFSKVSSNTNKITSSIGKGLTSILKGLGSIISSVSSIGVLIGAISLVGIIGMIALAVGKSEEAKAKLEQIVNMIMNLIDMLAQALLPLAKAIVDVIYKIFLVIGSILKEWFGIDLFAERTNDSLNKSVKSAKALRKQLMGFDEMNILNKDTGSTGIGGVSGGTATTNLKFNVDEASLKKAYQKVKNFFLDLPIPINIDYVGDAIKNPKEYGKTFLERIASGFSTGGHTIGPSIISAIFGEDSFMTKIGDIGSAIVNPIGTILSKVRGFGAKLGGKFAELITGGNKKETNANFNKIIQNFNKMSDSMKKFLHLPDGFADNLVDEFMNATNEIDGDIVRVTTKSGKSMEFTREQYADLMGSIIHYSQYGSKEQQKDMQNVANKSLTTSDNTKKNWFTSLNDIIAKATGKDDKSFFGGLTSAFNNIENESSKSGDNTKKNWFKTIGDLINDTKTKVDEYNKNPKKLKVEVEEDKQKSSKTVMGSMIDFIKKYNVPQKTVKINADTLPFINEIKKLAKASPVLFLPIVNALKNVGYKVKKGAIIRTPKLASGGIINRPGRGVPLASGGAIGGEAGREAVLPLTDSQQMALLGREIGKNVVINFTGLLDVDGRRLATTTAQVMNELEFSSNGGAL